MNWTAVSSRAAAGLVAGVAGYASFNHIVKVARDAGEHLSVAVVLPLSIDGLIVVGTMAMIDDKRHGRQPRLSARVALGFGVIATLAANVASARDTVTARLVAAVPAIAFLIAVEVLARNDRIRAAEDAGVAHPATRQPIDVPQLPVPVAPVFLAPVSAPPAPAEESGDGAPEPEEPAGQRVRQDARTAQQIELVVRAMRASDPKLSQRKIAEAAMVPLTTVRRILQRIPEPFVEPAGPVTAGVNGKTPALSGAGHNEEDRADG